MDIGQAVRRLRSGARMRRDGWEDKTRFIDPEDAAENKEPILTYEDLLANDWEEESDG